MVRDASAVITVWPAPPTSWGITRRSCRTQRRSKRSGAGELMAPAPSFHRPTHETKTTGNTRAWPDYSERITVIFTSS